MKKNSTRKPTRVPEKLSKADKEAHEDIGRRLHAFAGQAYSAALRYYVKHWDNPDALAAFTRALEGKKESAR